MVCPRFHECDITNGGTHGHADVVHDGHRCVDELLGAFVKNKESCVGAVAAM